MTGSRLADLVGSVDTQLATLVDAACDEVVRRIPAYGDERSIPVDELRRSIERNLRALIAALQGPERTLDVAAARRTGERRARQGVPLPEVLQAYRLSFATLWDSLVAHARRSQPSAVVEELLDAASTIWQLTDQHALALTESYRAATAEMLLADQRRRSAVVEGLLSGQPGAGGGRWEAATMLGFPPNGPLLVVVADTAAFAEESLPRIEQRLAAAGIVSAWRLTPAQQMGLLSVAGDRESKALDLLRSVATARVGVSPVFQSLADAPRSLHLAQAALGSVPPGSRAVAQFSPSPLAALMVNDPQEGARLADGVLGPILGLPAEERARLVETLNAYFDNGGSAGRAAAAIHCHPNTVRYRLRRVQELTGRKLSDPRALAELAAATYAAGQPPLSAPTNPSSAPGQATRTRPKMGRN